MNRMTAPIANVGAKIRHDQRHIANMIEEGARVLDVGCGDGALLHHLVHHRQVDGRGIELSREGVTACFHLGLSVIQGDAEDDLKEYPSASFDYVILSQTLQTIHGIQGVVDQLLRIGRRAIVSFPNFGHWRVRWKLLTSGHAPSTDALPYKWYDSPNIRILTILDILEFCRDQNITVERMLALGDDGREVGGLVGDQIGGAGNPRVRLANLRATQGLLLISRS
jgi:methionine biosynthesis protein MetW